MTIVELLKYYEVDSMAPYAAYVYTIKPGYITTADWWITMGGPDKSVKTPVRIADFLYKPSSFYSSEASIADVISTPESYYWDQDNQILYIHILHTDIPLVSFLEKGISDCHALGGDVVIGDIFYRPDVQSIPQISQTEDLADYDKLAFISGSIVFDNLDGYFDEMKDLSLYGNRVFLYYLDKIKGKHKYLRSDLQALATLYVEDHSNTLEDFTIDVQDLRKISNSNILTEYMTEEESNLVPLIYGTIRSYEPTVIDDELWSPIFKLGTRLTDIGTVQVESDYGWITVTPFDVDLNEGTFKISYTSCRTGGEPDGTILPVRVNNFTGIVNTSVLDVVEDLNERILGIKYNSTNYDTEAWELAKESLLPVGIVFDSQQLVYEAIAKLQNGSNLRWRYYISASGKRTAILDNWDKINTWDIRWSDIKDNLNLNVETDSSLLAATITVSYDEDYVEEEFLTHLEDSQKEAVSFKYRQSPDLPVTVYSTELAAAKQRAEQLKQHYSSIPNIWKGTLNGSKFFFMKIYDITLIKLSTPTREYYGKWKAQIISVTPKLDSLETDVEAVLTEPVIEYDMSMGGLFNGVSSYINLSTHSSSFSLTDGEPFEIEALIKTTNSIEHHMVIFQCRQDSPSTILYKLDIFYGYISFELDPTGVGEVLTAGFVADGLKHLVKAVYNGSTMEIFKDGISQGTLDLTTYNAMTDLTYVAIGARNNVSTLDEIFDGYIRDVKFSKSDELVSEWPLDEGSGSVAYDSVSDNNGTITDMTYKEF